MPTIAFAATWLALATLLTAVADDSALVSDVTRIAAQPLWFLAVYLLVVAVAPLQLRLHRAHPALGVVAVIGVVVALDTLRLSEVAPGPAVVNYLAVFLVAQALGFAHAEGRFDGVGARPALLVAAGSAVALVTLTTVGPFPVSMIGLPGQRISNMSPPTAAVLVLTVLQASLLLAARGPLTAWLDRPRVWRATVVANLVVLSTFLWHLSAYIAVGAALLALGLPVVEVGTTDWWLQKVALIVLSAAALGAVVAVVSPLERWSGPLRAPGHLARRSVGVAAAVLGLAGLALAGFGEPLVAGRRDLLGLHLSPLAAVALLVGGWVLARSPAAPGPAGEVTR